MCDMYSCVGVCVFTREHEQHKGKVGFLWQKAWGMSRTGLLVSLPFSRTEDIVGLLLLSSTRTGKVGPWEWTRNIPDPPRPQCKQDACPPSMPARVEVQSWTQDTWQGGPLDALGSSAPSL